MSEHSDNVIQYFYNSYNISEGLTKEILREFMIDHHIYSNHKFILMSSFVFGQYHRFLPWS